MEAKQVISLKVLVNKEKNQVVFVESNKDFVDILFSFLTLPMGTIVRLVREQSSSVIGCVNSIYESVENLGANLLRAEDFKTMLLYPRNAAEARCKNLKIDMGDASRTVYCSSPEWDCSHRTDAEVVTSGDEEGGGFVKGEPARFMITDDLQVLPVSMSTCISLLQKLGVKDVNAVEERTVEITRDEVLHILNYSFLSKEPLTEAILLKRGTNVTVQHEPRYIAHHGKIRDSNSGSKDIKMKLMVRKWDKKVVCGEATEDLVNLLFSFLIFPLGSISKLLDGNSSMGCIDNLYKSVEVLSIDNYMKSDECTNLLLCPKLTPNIVHVNQLDHDSEILDLRSYYLSRFLASPKATSTFNSVFGSPPRAPVPTRKNSRGVGFMKGPVKYMITDDLIVTPLSPISGISLLDRSNIPISDIEEQVVSIGEDEALSLMKASLISKAALSTVFNQ